MELFWRGRWQKGCTFAVSNEEKKLNGNMKKKLFVTLMVFSFLGASAQTGVPLSLTLEDCHRLALEYNKQLKIAEEKVAETDALKKMALSEMFPKFSANGAYTWNQKSIQLLSDEKQDALNNMGTNAAQDVAASVSEFVNRLMPIDPALAQSFAELLEGSDVAHALNGLGQQITSTLDMDLRNIWVGGVTVTQPVFLGGKLVEFYRSARTTNEMAQLGYDKAKSDILVQVDEAYWRVISVQKKLELAQQYANLLDTMYQNVQALKEAEMATEADLTKVRVKLNEAQMSLTKATSGLQLAKMLLYQMCGLDLNGNYLVLESLELQDRQSLSNIDMSQVLNNSKEIQLLEKSDALAKSAVHIAASGLMPNLAVTGSYLATNPNLYNGYSKGFGGMFTVGAVLNVPICHPSAVYALKAAKHQRNEVQYLIEEASDKIQLLVNKLNYELEVANRKLMASQTNLTHAEENLSLAEESFKSGLISSSDLMAAQTAWLSASSELLDAGIEVQMDYLYLQQAMGRIGK